jgi:hypothetical protein
MYLAPAVRSLVLAQVVEWNPMIINNKDDIIDLLGYVDEMMQNYSGLMVKTTFDTDNYSGTSYHGLTSDLPF